MHKRHWIFPAILIAAIIMSVAKRQPPTTGEHWLAAMNTHHLPTREALLLMDYSPDQELITAARLNPPQHGIGPAPGYGLQPTVIADQNWIRTKDATLYWPSPDSLRASLEDAAKRLHDSIDAATTTTLAAALASLNQLTDEQLLLAWIHADRGVLAEINDQTDAARQALLLLAQQNPGPILTFTVADNRVYLLPDDRTRDAAWCRLAAFDKSGKQLWIGILRIDGTPSTEHVRTIAVVTAREALTPPAIQTDMPPLIHF